MKTENSNVAVIDKIFIPKSSIPEISERSAMIARFIKSLPGLVSEEEFEQEDADGNLTLITIAVWENEDSIGAARKSVQARFYGTGENTHDLMGRLNVKMERGIYKRK